MSSETSAAPELIEESGRVVNMEDCRKDPGSSRYMLFLDDANSFGASAFSYRKDI
jgi:hypothetical protein